MFGTRPLTPNSAGITGPMNINSVIAHLVEMTPPQRKQFAQMHMDDPMMLSAAKFVDNQIAKQAQSIAAQQTGAAPPPVNQQVVAQMSPQPPAPQAAPMPQAEPQDEGQAQPMPEDSGIAQLPAPNMQGMAAGGIVAFDEGGAVETYRGMDGKIYKRTKQPGFLDFLADKFSAGSVESQQQQLQAQAAGEMARRQAAGQMLPQNVQGADVSSVVSAGYSGPRPRNKTATAEVPAASPAARKDDRPFRDKANYTPAPPAPKEKTGIDRLRTDKVESAARPSEAQPAATSPDYGQMYSNILKAQPDARANLPKEIGEIEALEKEQGNRKLESVKKREQGLAALTAKREDRLAKREGALSQQEGLNPYMAMINAGLSMMQSTGKGLAGIAAGAEKGMGQFAEGVKLNTTQRQKIDDARDALDDLRFNQETMSEKERNEAYDQIKQGAVATRTATISYIQHRDDVNAKTAGRIFDANTQQVLEGQRQKFETGMQAQREAGANARAAMQERGANARASQLPGEARTLMALGGGDLKRGMEMQAAITAGKFNPMNAYIQYYLPSVAKDPTAQAKSFDQFKAMLGMDVTRP